MEAGTENTSAPAQRPPFKVRGTASIKHLNVRKEGPEDEKVLACDVKMVINGVDGRICAYFDDALEEFLWRGETNAKIVRNAFMGPVEFLNTVTGADVHIGNERFGGCDVKGFAIEPRDGGVVNLHCSARVYPGSDQLDELGKLVQEDAGVEIEGPPDLFAAAPAPAPAPTSGSLPLDGDRDELYANAKALVRTQNRASISLVQRHLQIGYNRAARILEQLQDGGVVSPMDATGKRHVKPATTGEQQ